MPPQHDICGECGRPVEPARHGGQRRKGKDGLRRCVACQARRIGRERPVREPRDACDDCGTAIGTERERRHMCGDGFQRCGPCYREYRRARQRKTPPPDRRPGQNPPCGECGEPMADGWARRIGRDGVYRCRACSYQKMLIANRPRCRLAHQRQRARQKAARAEGAETIQREGIVKRIIRGLITGAVLVFTVAQAQAQWKMVEDVVDPMDGSTRSAIQSPMAAPMEGMGFPYTGTKSAAAILCGDGGITGVAFGFTNAPNLVGGSLLDGHRSFMLRVRFDDDPLMRWQFVHEWGSRLIFSGHRLHVLAARMQAARTMLLELPWHGQGNVVFRYDLTGSRAAVEEACRASH